MVVKYKCKREKFQVTKWWATDEQRTVREMERIMDVELFLRIQGQWAEDSPHCMAIIHEMFQHAAAKGQKEVEWIIHQGHWQNLPQLNPEAGIPAVQLVGPKTSMEELLELYLEVYKLHRLPGSPPGEPVLLEEVLPSLEDHQGCKEEKASAATVRPCPKDPHSSRSGIPQKGKRDSLVERSLAMVCEAHQDALAMVATLEEEIERLNCTQNHSELRVRSKSRDCQGWSGEEQKRRCHQLQFEDPLPPAGLLTQRWGLVRREPPVKALTWRSHQNWGQQWPPSWEGLQRPLRMKAIGHLWSLQSWSSASGFHGRLRNAKPWTGGLSCQWYQG